MAKTDSNNQLYRGIVLGKNTEVLSILQGADPYYTSSSNKAILLLCAAEYGNKDLVQYLIDNGTNIDAQNNKGETPLILAVRGNHVETVKVLLQANADVCIPDAMGQCTLAIAFNVFEDISRNIRQLILGSVTITSLCKSPQVKTAVFHNNCSLDNFVPLKNVELIRTLLDMGTLVNVKNKNNGKTALHKAVEYLDIDILKLLLERGADVNARDFLGRRPLAFIKDYNEAGKTLEIVRILLKAGATLINHDPTEILMRSILSNGNKELIHEVLQSNINLYIENKRSRMPIEYLFENKNPGIYEELKHFKVDFNNSSNIKTKLLHCSAALGNATLLQLLLEHGVNVNAKDCYNCSPLFMAVDPLGCIADRDLEFSRTRRFNCIELLLENGANPQILTEDISYNYITNFDDPSVINLATELMRPVLIHLALHQASGRTINPFMLSEIEKRPEFKTIFDSNKQQLQEIKQIKIDESVTLFDFLIANKISLYAQNQVLISNLVSILKEFQSDSYYYHKLQEKFLKLIRFVTINEVFVKLYNVSAIKVVEKIVDYV